MSKKLLVSGLLALMAVAAHAGVELNKADQAALEGVRGIGPGLSAKLLEERKKGAFKSWDDVIDRVRGVGPANAAKLSSAGLTVNDAPYAVAAEAAKPVKAEAAAKPVQAAKPAKPDVAAK